MSTTERKSTKTRYGCRLETKKYVMGIIDQIYKGRAVSCIVTEKEWNFIYPLANYGKLTGEDYNSVISMLMLFVHEYVKTDGYTEE